jgi:hypothetical protein
MNPFTGNLPPSRFFIGWDVGGWNCDHNSQSRDAIVILDQDLSLVGVPWRGNLRELINSAMTTPGWIEGLFRLCQAEPPKVGAPVTMAIDTPLGFSNEFRNLLNGCQAGTIGNSQDNPYLYRATERYLFRLGRRPLSPIKDMIGSQATKGLHVLAKFAPRVQSCGVWTDGARLQVFESYPSASRDMPVVMEIRRNLSRMPNADIEDALTCAMVAFLFRNDPAALDAPGPQIPSEEGWIWVPKAIPTG